MKTLNLFIFCLCLLSLISPSTPTITSSPDTLGDFYQPIIRVDVLFVLSVADEVQVFWDLFEALRLDTDETSFAVLVMGEADEYLGDDLPMNTMSLVDDLCIENYDSEGSVWQTLEEKDLMVIIERFGINEASTRPKLIVSGTNSLIQRQILERYRSLAPSNPSIGFMQTFIYDVLDPSAMWLSFMNQTICTHVWVTAHAFIPVVSNVFDGEIECVGRPSGWYMRQTRSEADMGFIKQQFASILSEQYRSKSVLLYYGGFGSMYGHCLGDALSALVALNITRDYAVVLVPTGGSNGEVERTVVDQMKLKNQVAILPDSISIVNASLYSVAGLTQRSSLCADALSIDKECIFIQGMNCADTNSTLNVIVTEDLSPLVSNAKALGPVFSNLSHSAPPFFFNISRLYGAGIPVDSGELVVAYLRSLFHHTFDRQKAEYSILLNQGHCIPDSGGSHSGHSAFWWFLVVGLPSLFVLYLATVPCISVCVYYRAVTMRANRSANVTHDSNLDDAYDQLVGQEVADEIGGGSVATGTTTNASLLVHEATTTRNTENDYADETIEVVGI